MTGNVAPTFWQKTLEAFKGKKVKLRLRSGVVHEGELASVGATGAVLEVGKASVIQTVAYVDLLECTEP